VLEVLGYSVDVAGDGVAGVAKATRSRYDAILMDVQMPRMDGYDATRAIRAQEADGARVPIIAMTAAAVEGERDKCLTAGMDDFLTKPLEPSRLDATLREWLGGPAADPAPPAEVRPVGAVLDVTRIETLRAMGPGADELVERAVSRFVSGAPDTVAEIRAAVAAGDAARLREVAHKLKGSALNLGAGAVGALCLELELCGNAGDVSAALGLVPGLEVAVQAASAALLDFQLR
jgi:hypothetical protein